MKIKKDLTGERFGLLTVVKPLFANQHRQTVYECLCDCGNITQVRSCQLTSQRTKSCGCLRHKHQVKKHGATHTSLYNVWKSMRQRCNNPSSTTYIHYGKRGIKVCNEWEDFIIFSQWAHDNGYKPGLTIERINVDGDYCPTNCTWIPFVQQARNTTRTRLLSYNQQTKSLLEWATEYGLTPQLIHSRLAHGWTVERALTQPVRKNSAKQ